MEDIRNIQDTVLNRPETKIYIQGFNLDMLNRIKEGGVRDIEGTRKVIAIERTLRNYGFPLPSLGQMIRTPGERDGRIEHIEKLVRSCKAYYMEQDSQDDDTYNELIEAIKELAEEGGESLLPEEGKTAVEDKENNSAPVIVKEAPQSELISEDEAYTLLRRFIEGGLVLEGFSIPEKLAMHDLSVKLWGSKMTPQDMANYHSTLGAEKQRENQEANSYRLRQAEEIRKEAAAEAAKGTIRAEALGEILGIIQDINEGIASGDFTATESWQEVKVLLASFSTQGKLLDMEPIAQLLSNLRAPVTQDLLSLVLGLLTSYNEIFQDKGVRKQLRLITDRELSEIGYMFQQLIIMPNMTPEHAVQIITSRMQTGAASLLGKLGSSALSKAQGKK
jgi:hypothetical protein